MHLYAFPTSWQIPPFKQGFVLQPDHFSHNLPIHLTININLFLLKVVGVEDIKKLSAFNHLYLRYILRIRRTDKIAHDRIFAQIHLY